MSTSAVVYSFGAISHKIALVAVQSTVKELLRD